MLERAEMIAAGLGKESLSLQVSSINEPAISLYQGMGFHDDGVISTWYVTEADQERTDE